MVPGVGEAETWRFNELGGEGAKCTLYPTLKEVRGQPHPTPRLRAARTNLFSLICSQSHAHSYTHINLLIQ